MSTKTTQFTPGPWVVNTFIVNGQHKLEVLDATGDNACIQANAHLIAAAPAMYEALQGALKNIDRLNDKRSAYRAQWIKAVQVALAQAEGRQA